MRLIFLRILWVCGFVCGLLPGADNSLLGLLMPDARMVAGVNVERARGSDFGKFLVSQVKTEDQNKLNDLTLRTGFDPGRDLAEMLVATSQTDPKHGGLLVASGTFDLTRIVEEAKRQGAGILQYKSATVIASKDEQGWAAFQGSTFLAGDRESVERGIDRLDHAATLNPEIVAKVAEMRGAYDLWAVSAMPFSQLAQSAPDQNLRGTLNNPSLESIQQTSVGLKLGATVEFLAEAATKTDEDAVTLANVVRFFSGLILSNKQNPPNGPLMSLVKSLGLETRANVVTLRLSLPEEQLEEMIKSARKPGTLPSAAAPSPDVSGHDAERE